MGYCGVCRNGSLPRCGRARKPGCAGSATSQAPGELATHRRAESHGVGGEGGGRQPGQHGDHRRREEPDHGPGRVHPPALRQGRRPRPAADQCDAPDRGRPCRGRHPLGPCPVPGPHVGHRHAAHLPPRRPPHAALVHRHAGVGGIAAREILGVHDMGGGLSRTFGAVRDRAPGGRADSGAASRSASSRRPSTWTWSSSTAAKSTPLPSSCASLTPGQRHTRGEATATRRSVMLGCRTVMTGRFPGIRAVGVPLLSSPRSPSFRILRAPSPRSARGLRTTR